jgi:hypothetical protein
MESIRRKPSRLTRALLRRNGWALIDTLIGMPPRETFHLRLTQASFSLPRLFTCTRYAGGARDFMGKQWVP